MKSSYTHRALWSWAFYDFANTIFSAVVLTSFFPLYFTSLAGSNWYLGVATTGAMILSGLLVPILGTLSDQTGKTKYYLMLSTLGCIVFFCLFSFFKNAWILLFIFTFSCMLFHTSITFYNSLLPEVAPPDKQGFASGLGIGLGYLGIVFILPIASWIGKHFGESWIFMVSGILFLICSIPLFVFVPEREVSNPISFRWSLWKEEWIKTWLLFKEICKKPVLLTFFAGNFFAVDALNTMIFWFLVFARAVFHPPQDQMLLLMAADSLAAFFMGLLTGVLSDKIRALPTLLLSVGALMITTIALTIVPSFQGFILISLLLSTFAMAGIWTAGRKALLELAPKENVGEYFGFYGLTTKVSVIGNLVFSLVADAAGFKPALRVLLFPATAGFLFLATCWFLKSKEPA